MKHKQNENILLVVYFENREYIVSCSKKVEEGQDHYVFFFSSLNQLEAFYFNDT